MINGMTIQQNEILSQISDSDNGNKMGSILGQPIAINGDTLVSIVNDNDVTNMMEEYEKWGSGDGFTRLRNFLFPHPDQDGSLHYVDGR